MIEKNGRNQSVQESVFRYLRKNILELTLLPGTIMSANEVSNMMQVSRTPVREAFIRLEREGLVNVIPQKETTVSPIDLERSWQEQFLRESLEIAALTPFIEKCLPEDIRVMRHYIELQKKKVYQGDYISTIEIDDSFHQMIFLVAKQPLSWGIIESMSGHYRRCRILAMQTDEIGINATFQHEDLVKELESGDLEAAQVIMRTHLRRLFDEKKILLEKYPGYFQEEGKDQFKVDFTSLNAAKQG
jgi:DNA-binding GntR family transcriptional regulator